MSENKSALSATKKIPKPLKGLGIRNAGDGGRTHTVSPPTDFESVSSANSNTPAYVGTLLVYQPHAKLSRHPRRDFADEKFNSQMQQLFAYIFVHFIAPQQGRQHPLFCWQPVITPILLHRLYHITPFSTIYLYFALFIYPSCRNAQFPQALPKYDLA